MYRAAFVTPEMLLIEYSMEHANSIAARGFDGLLPQRREPTLSAILRIASAFCGLR